MLFIEYFVAPGSQRGPKDLLENKMLSSTEATLETIRNLGTCSENVRERLTEELKDTLKDWASAKSGNSVSVVFVWLDFIKYYSFYNNSQCLWI